MGITRRRMLAAGGGAVGLAAAAGVGYEARGAPPRPENGPSTRTVRFDGVHQAGIATPAQDRLVFGAFDFVGERREDLRDLLREWTGAARLMTAGQPVGTTSGEPALPPVDTGEASGLLPSRLTVTVGFGPSLFDRERLGIGHLRPAHLRALGPLPGDQLQADRSDGDLCVQACADDPQVAFHAVRNLLRIGRGLVELRWLQLGFGVNTSTTSHEPTPRNLMGFKDGTRNIKVDEPDRMKKFVWVAGEEPKPWFRGGSYLVARRIRMRIETWDHAPLSDQEATIGRHKATGAPLGGRQEFDTPKFSKLPVDAHIRLAEPGDNEGEAILRRGYAYTDGIDSRTGLLDAGLFFVCFQRDPHRQFAAIQRRLGQLDALNEYIEHTASGLFAIPPGTRRGEHIAQALFS